jgi:hypothetical protein
VAGLCLGTSPVGALTPGPDLLVTGGSLDAPSGPTSDTGSVGEALIERLRALEWLTIEVAGDADVVRQAEPLTPAAGLVLPLLAELEAANPIAAVELRETAARFRTIGEPAWGLWSWRATGARAPIHLASRLEPSVVGQAGAGAPASLGCTLDVPLGLTVGPLTAEARLLEARWQTAEPWHAAVPLDLLSWAVKPPPARRHLEIGDALSLDVAGRLVVEGAPGELGLRSALELADLARDRAFAVRPSAELDIRAGARLASQPQASFRVATEVSDDLLAAYPFSLGLEYLIDDLLAEPGREPVQRLMLRLCL